jgi:hypothetical protein
LTLSLAEQGNDIMSKARLAVLAGLAFAALGTAPAAAKEFVDYGYAPGLWRINVVDCDPNHIDDYLVGLKASQVPAFEVLKKHKIIDEYRFMVRTGYTADRPSVLIAVHYTSADAMMPNATRDAAINKEIEATFSDDQSKTAVAGYEKYRKFVDDTTWLTIDFGNKK